MALSFSLDFFTGGPSSLHVTLACQRCCITNGFTKVCMGCQRFFLKRRENVMFSNKIDLPYCLVVFFVVCPRLRPFWSVFGELACFWCSTAKIKTRQHRDFRSVQECPSLEANNSAGKLPPASIPPEIQSRDVAVPCPFTRFAIPPTDRSLALLLSLARSASQFRIRLVQTAVDPEIWFINGVDKCQSERLTKG